MRLAVFIVLLIAVSGCAGSKKAGSATAVLNGTWVPVQQEMGGRALPASFYQSQQMIISDSNYTVTAESVDRGVVSVHDNKIDIYGRDGVNKGKHFTAIYKYEHEQLTICYDLSGKDYPQAFDTKGKPLYFLSVFRKVKK